MRKVIETRQRSARQTKYTLQRESITLETWQMTWASFKSVFKSFRLWACVFIASCMLAWTGMFWFWILLLLVLFAAVALLNDFITRYPVCKYNKEQARKQALKKVQQEQKLRMQLLREQQEREARDRQFFELSKTTCNRCGSPVRAYKRIFNVAHYTCGNCRKSFTVKLYDPDKLK